MRPAAVELTSPPDLSIQAAEATAAGSKSFYFATRFFPPELARAAHAVYWFCRYTDDLVDEAPSAAQGQVALTEWRAVVSQALETGRATHPVLCAFLPVVNKHQIPHEYPYELLEGMQMDLDQQTYPDFPSLRLFCYRVASVVGLMMSHVIGFEGEPQPYAIDLGIAMQLTNILRDVGEDLERGHIYLPLEELCRFEYSREDLLGRVRDERFRRLMRFQVARARDYYERAQPGVSMLNAEGRFAVQIASDVYGAILSKIEESDFDVFERRAVVSARRKYWITARRLTGPLLRQMWQRAGGRRGAA